MDIKTVPCTRRNHQHRTWQPNVFSWIYSPSGKYAADIYYVEMDQNEDHPDTHYFIYGVSILDVVNGSWREYRTLCGPLKSMYAVYWLQDDCLILVNHSRRDSVLTQNIIYLDHKTRTADCTLARSYAWNVDEMMHMWDCTCQPLKINNRVYLLAFAHRDDTPGIICRLFPFNPLQMRDVDHSEYNLHGQRVVRSFTQALHVTGHPIVFGSKFYVATYGLGTIRNARIQCEYNVSQFLCVDMESVVREGKDIITAETPGVRLVTFPVPFAPQWKPHTRSISNMSNSGSEIVFWPRPKFVRRRPLRTPAPYPVYVVDLEKGTTTKTTAILTGPDFLTFDRFGTLSAWFQRREEPIRTQPISFPQYSPSSLFDICRKKVLSEYFGTELQNLSEISILFQ